MHFRGILETTAALSSSRCKYSQLSSCFCTRIAHHWESLEVFFTTADTTHCFFHGKIPRGASRPSRLTFCSITVWIIAVKRKYNFAALQKPFFTTSIKEEWLELYWNIKKNLAKTSWSKKSPIPLKICSDFFARWVETKQKTFWGSWEKMFSVVDQTFRNHVWQLCF